MAIFHRNAELGQERIPISYEDYLAYREQASTFESLEGTLNTNVPFSDAGSAPEPYRMSRVTPGFFTMLGVQLLIGRGLTPADAVAGAAPVLLLSHALWRDRYGESPDAVGRTVRAGDELATIAGVMPRGFGFPNAQQLWMPLTDTPELRDRAQRNLMLTGKYARGVSREQARAGAAMGASRWRIVRQLLVEALLLSG